MKQKNKILSIALFLLSQFVITPLISQQNNWWKFGRMCSVDFNTSTPTVTSSGSNFSEATSTISDANGNLLFFTDGVKIFKSNGQIMPDNGGSTTYSMSGDLSTTQTIIVAKPGSSSIYYVFTIKAVGGSKVKYSVVDMNLNSGTVITLNSTMPDPSGTSLNDTEKITAIKNCNGTDYWVITHENGNNKFKVFPITTSGIGNPIISSQGMNYTSVQASQGAMKVSPDGKYLCSLAFDLSAQLFNFNSSTGNITFNQTIYNVPSYTSVYSVEFSQNSRYLFFTFWGSNTNKGIYRFDINNPGNPLVNIAPASTVYYKGIQAAPDGNIYVSRTGKNYLSKISNTNAGGSFTEIGLQLVSLCEDGLPNFPISTTPNCSTASFTFTNPGQNVVTLPSYYGPQQVTEVCPPNVFIDGSACTNENGYYLDIRSIDLTTWNTTVLYSAWICSPPSNCEVPSSLNLTNYYPGFQSGVVYLIGLSVGPQWNTDMHLVRIKPSPSISVSPDTTICNGSSANLNVTSTNWPVVLTRSHLLHPVSYNSSPIIVSPTSTTAYTISTTNSVGCTASDVAVVTVSNCPTACFNFNNLNQRVLNEDSKYGPIPVTTMCLPNVIIDGDCSSNENGYFIIISEFDLINWQNIAPTFYEGWIPSSTQVPNGINLSTLISTLSSNTPNGAHTFIIGHVYMVGLAVGPLWNSTQQFFRVKNCTARTGQFEFEKIENPMNTNLLNQITIYPNPTSGKFNIQFNETQVQKITVYDAIGKVIIENNVEANTSNLSLDLSDLKSGIYFIKVNSNENVIMKKIIKE